MPKAPKKTKVEAGDDASEGLVCIKCAGRYFLTIRTEPGRNNTIRRTRRCYHCTWTVTTTEKIDSPK